LLWISCAGGRIDGRKKKKKGKKGSAPYSFYRAIRHLQERKEEKNIEPVERAEVGCHWKSLKMGEKKGKKKRGKRERGFSPGPRGAVGRSPSIFPEGVENGGFEAASPSAGLAAVGSGRGGEKKRGGPWLGRGHPSPIQFRACDRKRKRKHETKAGPCRRPQDRLSAFKLRLG